MGKDDYVDRVYGMRYKQFSKVLSRRMMEVRDCKGYEDFKADIKILRNARSNCGKASLISNYWMKSICNMPKKELIKLVEGYKKGMFDPYKYDAKEYDFKKANEEEEEENSL